MLKKLSKNLYVLALLGTLAALVFMVVYNYSSYYSTMTRDMEEVGTASLAQVTEQLEGHLEKGQNVLQATAVSVEYMMENHSTPEEIEEILVLESERYKAEIEQSFTGVYGLFDGVYLDGVGWIPDEGYDPKSRVWYKDAMEANGKPALVSPYVDAQTGNVMISVSKMLQDGESVISLDIVMDQIQEIAEQISLNGLGYGFVVDRNGLVVAHHDVKEKGKNYLEAEAELVGLLKKVYADETVFRYVLDGEEYTVFSDTVMEDWNVLMLVSNDKLLSDAKDTLKRNVLIGGLIATVIVFLYMFTVRKTKQSMELRREKMIADTANRAKSDFLANMSHEIRTPINAVLGMNEMILRECRDETIREYAFNAQSAGQNLLSIINDILDMSKIEAGKMEIVNGKYRLSTVLTDVVNMIQMKAENKRLAFHVDVDETIPDRLLGDEVRIRQIMVNLLNNAVKYTNSGSVWMKVEKELQSEEKIVLKVSVRDTGIGIKEEDKGKLFRNFERLDQRKNRNIEGTGLGLAITGKMVELMEGRIEVESTYGEGSTFTVYLPQVVRGPEQIGNFEEKHRAYVRSVKQYSESFIAPEASVLVVDDVDMNIAVVKSLLKKTQLKVSSCTGGEECLRLVQKEKFDVILLDHMMPEMDGIETLRRMKQMEENLCKNTPVIALTANAIVGAKEMYLAAGFDSYLSKPIVGERLEEILKTYLPKEKVMLAAMGTGKEVREAGQNAEDELAATNETETEPARELIDTEVGLRYSADSEEIYYDFLAMFVKSQTERIPQLAEYYREEDWPQYTILVHSIKSTALNIGGVILSEQAKALEMAGKENRIAYIKEHHEELVRLNEETVKACEEILKSGVGPGEK